MLKYSRWRYASLSNFKVVSEEEEEEEEEEVEEHGVVAASPEYMLTFLKSYQSYRISNREIQKSESRELPTEKKEVNKQP